MNSSIRLIINGERREGSEGGWGDVINPATGESVGRVAYASPADLDEALAREVLAGHRRQLVAAGNDG